MKCPNCGEELPLLSNVCPCCRKPIMQDFHVVDVAELVNAIDSTVLSIQKVANNGEGFTISFLTSLYWLIAAVGSGVIAYVSGAGLLWIIASVFAVVTVLNLLRKSPAKKSVQQYKDARLAYENGLSLVKRYYPGNKEMEQYVAETRRKVTAAESAIDSQRRKKLIVGIIIAVVEVLLVAGVSTWAAGKQSPEQQETASSNVTKKVPKDYDGKITFYIANGQPEQAVSTFASSEFNNEYSGGDKRADLCRSLLAAGYTAEAQSFFLAYCQGKTGDLDCATLIVNDLKANNKSEDAAAFVSACSGLRYASDLKKLNQLLK